MIILVFICFIQAKQLYFHILTSQEDMSIENLQDQPRVLHEFMYMKQNYIRSDDRSPQQIGLLVQGNKNDHMGSQLKAQWHRHRHAWNVLVSRNSCFYFYTYIWMIILSITALEAVMDRFVLTNERAGAELAPSWRRPGNKRRYLIAVSLLVKKHIPEMDQSSPAFRILFSHYYACGEWVFCTNRKITMCHNLFSTINRNE